MAPTKTTQPKPAEAPKRMTLSQVVERMTDRSARSKAAAKMSAQGVFMPDVEIVSGESWDAVRTMVDQAEWAFTELVNRAQGNGAAPKKAEEEIPF